MGNWGLSNSSIEAVCYHHQPSKTRQDQVNALVLVHVAKVFDYEFSNLGNRFMNPALDNAFIERLATKERISDWKDYCSEQLQEKVGMHHLFPQLVLPRIKKVL